MKYTKARRVIVVAKIVTDLPLSEIRRAAGIALYITMDGILTNYSSVVEQVQANVVEPKTKKKKK